MERRRVLQAVGGAGLAGLSGCTTLVNSVPEKLVSSTPDQRTVTLVEQDTVPDEYQTQIEVDLLTATITADHTARIRVTTTNQGPARYISNQDSGCGFFTRWAGGSDEPPGLWLNWPNYEEAVDRKDNRWVWDRAPDKSRYFYLTACHAPEYEPGESIENRYDVWDDYRVDGYLEPGVYRWEETITIADERSPPEEETRSFPWGFSLEITQS